jgi:hypothetical protein
MQLSIVGCPDKKRFRPFVKRAAQFYAKELLSEKMLDNIFVRVKFNKDLDHKDFIFAIVPDTMEFEADIYFKIDDEGNYEVKNYYKFKNNYKNIIDMDGFEHTHIDKGTWGSGTKVKSNKIFYIKSEDNSNRNRLTLGGCFSSLGIQDRILLNTYAKRLPANSIAVETYSGMGGRASILNDSPSITEIHAFNNFNNDNIKKEFENVRPWIQNQLLDISKESSQSEELSIKYFRDLEVALDTDPSGRLFYNHITSNSSKIVLHESNSETIDKMIDLCFIACFDTSSSESEVNKWIPKIKQNGYIIVHPYDEKIKKELYDKYNSLLSNDFEFLNKKESIGIFKKL